MKADRASLRLAFILCAAAFCLAWAPRLLWGFWTDEAGTYWMASGGWREAIARCQAWTGQSILYGILESFFVKPGRFQEVWLRLPSLAGMAAAAWFTYQLAERFVKRGSGAAALVTLICLPDVVSFGTSARPYALVMGASVAATYFLLDWRERNAWAPALGYAASAALLVNLHYLAMFLLVPHALYLALVYFRGNPGWKLPLTAAVAIPLGALPVLSHMRSAAVHVAAFDGATKPELLQLLWFCVPPVILLAVGLGAGMSWLMRRRLPLQKSPIPLETTLLLAMWLVAAPVAFYLGATFTTHSIFATRYLLFAVPAAAILAAWAVTTLADPFAQRIVTCAVFAAPVLHPAMLMTAFGPAQDSWREPLADVRSFASSEPAPVFVASGLIESATMDWKSQNPANSRLFAALAAYPLPNPAYPLPYQFSPAVAQHMEAQLAAMPGVPILLLCEGDSPLVSWFSDSMKRRGYSVEERPINRMSVLRATPGTTRTSYSAR